MEVYPVGDAEIDQPVTDEVKDTKTIVRVRAGVDVNAPRLFLLRYPKFRVGIHRPDPGLPGALAPSMVSWHADAAASLTPQATRRRRGGEKGLVE